MENIGGFNTSHRGSASQGIYKEVVVMMHHGIQEARRNGDREVGRKIKVRRTMDWKSVCNLRVCIMEV